MMVRKHNAWGWWGLGSAIVAVSAIGLFIGCRGNYGASVAPSGNSDDFLGTGRTLSFFTAIQVDPQSEDSAGPQFVAAADLDSDGFIDLVSAWNQSQPVQIHLQRRDTIGNISFETVTLAGNIPVVSVAGLTIADFDQDGAPDIAVLLKDTMEAGATCQDSDVPDSVELAGLILVYLGPADGGQVAQALAWVEAPIEASRLAGAGSAGDPELGGFTGMTAGDADGDGDTDLVVAWNSGCAEDEASATVLQFTNGGFAAVRDRSWEVSVVPNPIPSGTSVKDVALGDIDADGDLDIVATFPAAGSMNIRWFRNPTIDVPDDFHFTSSDWQVGAVGQLATQADVARVADIDADGAADVLIRSTTGGLLQWFKGPGPEATTAPLPNLPWRVYTIAEFTGRFPRAIALGDVTLDGQVDIIASAGGAVVLLNADGASSLYDQWGTALVIDDDAPGRPGPSPSTTDPSVSPSEVSGGTQVNALLVVDLDADGANDVIATFDRSGLSGLTNDALVWFRNRLR